MGKILGQSMLLASWFLFLNTSDGPMEVSKAHGQSVMSFAKDEVGCSTAEV